MARENTWAWTAFGFAAGAGAAWAFDPRSGARHRAEVGHKAIHAGHVAACLGGKAWRDGRNRLRGALAELGKVFTPDEVDEIVLAERVRSHLGRVCSHPGAIDVQAEGGTVFLEGVVLKSEHAQVLACVRTVRGVREVQDGLEVHDSAARIPSLQGGAGRTRGQLPELLQENWAPSVRVAIGSLGLGLAGWGLRRRGVWGGALAVIGSALVLRGATNLPLRRALGLGAGRRAIDLRKSIFVAATPSEVFGFFTAFDRLPAFMSHLKEVRRTGDGRWRWCVAGPAGVPIEWDAEVTRLEQDRLVSWKSVEPSLVESAGTVRFRPENNGTRLEVQLSYNPPAGAVGHAFAALFGKDARSQMDDDLLRLKSMLERGKTEPVTPEQLT